jgi:hypothetical protein
VDLVGEAGGSLLVLMIEGPHSLHTHIMSSLYIYNAICHLLQWLQVIRMLPQPDICSLALGLKTEDWILFVVDVAVGSIMLVLMIETPNHFILIPALFYTYIMQFSTCYCG